jgi:hypothetical protein
MLTWQLGGAVSQTPLVHSKGRTHAAVSTQAPHITVDPRRAPKQPSQLVNPRIARAKRPQWVGPGRTQSIIAWPRPQPVRPSIDIPQDGR